MDAAELPAITVPTFITDPHLAVVAVLVALALGIAMIAAFLD